MGRQKGLTERGNTYVLSQWAPNIIQLTLQRGDYVMSETLENLRSEQEMLERRNMLEDELFAWVTDKIRITESTNEATN